MSALWNKARARMSAALRWMRDPNDALSELQLCGQGEIERIARDSGLSASEFRALRSLGSNAPDLLERRMAALDLDPAEVSAVAPNASRDLQRVCSLCESHGRCFRDLERKPADEGWKDYCPNVGTLETLNTLPWSSRSEW